MAIEQTVYDLVAPAVEAMGYELWGIEREGDMLRFYIDKEGGVGIDDCYAVHQQIISIMTVEEMIDKYRLEVSSPGWNRLFFFADQFQDYVGGTFKVKLSYLVNERRKFKAELLKAEGDTLTFNVDGEPFEVEFSAVDTARLDPKF